MQIAVFGLGKLGAPLAAVLANAGHNVCGVDVNQDFVDALNSRRAPVDEPGLTELIYSAPVLSATVDGQTAAKWADAIFITVPTPSRDDDTYNDEFVQQAVWSIGKGMADGTHYQLVVLVSTVMPGTTQDMLIPLLEFYSERRCGSDFGVCYSPEFIALGEVIRGMREPDLILIGESDKRAGDTLTGIYHTMCLRKPPIHRMKPKNAEAAKILLNSYVTMKMSFANSMSELCDEAGIDAFAIADALGSDSRIGRKYLTPATAWGGPCFPRDGRALQAFAKQNRCYLPLVEVTDRINQAQTGRLADRVLRLARTSKITVVGILGLTYKPNTAICEESAGVALMHELVDRQMDVVCYDPAVTTPAPDWPREVTLMPSLGDCGASAFLLVVMTPWPEFLDLPSLCRSIKGDTIIVDCWRMFKQTDFPSSVRYIVPGTPND